MRVLAAAEQHWLLVCSCAGLRLFRTVMREPRSVLLIRCCTGSERAVGCSWQLFLSAAVAPVRQPGSPPDMLLACVLLPVPAHRDVLPWSPSRSALRAPTQLEMVSVQTAVVRTVAPHR
jgi:hypothetical protein